MVEQPKLVRHSAVGAKTMLASAWLVGGFLFRRLAQLIVTVVLARLLVPADFGLVAISTTLLLSLMSVTELSLFNALIHEKDPTREDYDTAFTFSALRGVLLAAVMAVGGLVMARVYDDDRLFLVTTLLGCKPLLSGLTSPYYINLAKNLSFGKVTFWESMSAVAQVVSSTAVAYFTGSYWAIVAGVLFSSIVGLIASYWCAPYRPRFSIASWRNLMSFSVWMTLSQVASTVGNRFDNFLGAGILGTALFGAYNVGGNMATLVTQSAIQPLERVLFPSFASMVDDRPRLQRAFQRTQACLLAVGLPLGVGLAVVANPFVYLLLGPKWMIAALVIQFIAPVLALQIVFGPQSALAFSKGETRMLFNRSVAQIAFRIPIVFIGLYYFGFMGLLVSRFISGGIMVTIVNMYMVRKLIGITVRDQLLVCWRSLIASGVMAVVVMLASKAFPPIHNSLQAAEMLAVLVPLGAAVYCGVQGVLWLLAGKPELGIETEIVKIAEKALGRFNRQRQPAE